MLANSSSAAPIVLIATVQKSGTWNSIIFFWLLKQLSDHQEKPQYTPNLKHFLRDHTHKVHKPHKDILGIESLWICHTICPGFTNIDSPHQKEWDTLRFHLWGYNWGEEIIRNAREWDALDPTKTDAARVIYLYRNPLDQMVSFYAHAKEHIDEGHRVKTLTDGSRVLLNDLHDFVFNAGALGSYLKHYYTFKQMHACYPNNILLMPYEKLVTQPSIAFSAMLSFMGVQLDSDTKQKIFFKALELASKKNVMTVEADMDQSFVQDRLGNGKHVGDGAIGKWHGQYTREELEMIESIFNQFSISLHDFTLQQFDTATNDLPPKKNAIDPKKMRHYQEQFWEQQASLAEIQAKFPSFIKTPNDVSSLARNNSPQKGLEEQTN